MHFADPNKNVFIKICCSITTDYYIKPLLYITIAITLFLWSQKKHYRMYIIERGNCKKRGHPELLARETLTHTLLQFYSSNATVF